MARRSGLGKGLSALIPAERTSVTSSTLGELPISQVAPNRFQPRRTFDEEALASLTASIRELGVLQPILVRQIGDAQYELIAGERRWRAAKRAGLQTIPTIVRDADDTSSLEAALVENLHRSDLNALEEAAAYQQLIEDFGMTHEQVAQRVGRSRVTVTNTLRLFQLPPAIQRLVADGQLSAGHARALLATPDRAFQEHLAKRAVAEQLSVRQVEDAVRSREGVDTGGATTETAGSGTAPTRRLRPPGLLELEELLSEHLGTRVQVSMSAKRGKVVIDFADIEDLERLYRVMTGSATGE